MKIVDAEGKLCPLRDDACISSACMFWSDEGNNEGVCEYLAHLRK